MNGFRDNKKPRAHARGFYWFETTSLFRNENSIRLGKHGIFPSAGLAASDHFHFSTQDHIAGNGNARLPPN